MSFEENLIKRHRTQEIKTPIYIIYVHMFVYEESRIFSINLFKRQMTTETGANSDF